MRMNICMGVLFQVMGLRVFVFFIQMQAYQDILRREKLKPPEEMRVRTSTSL